MRWRSTIIPPPMHSPAIAPLSRSHILTRKETPMRAFCGLCAALALPILLGSSPALAQPTQPTETENDRVSRLEKRLDEMERRHQAELSARDAEIARLK